MIRRRLPIPSNWQDFESVCHALWKEIWGDPNTQKNGRSGQKQQGVDIFGVQVLTGRYAGVQCKDKDERLGRQVEADELEVEANRATGFQPELASFVLATTASRDAKVQARARELSGDGRVPFTVSVWSWDDIEEEILARPEIFRTFYGDLSQGLSVDSSGIRIGPATPRDLLTAFFSRPTVGERVPSQLAARLIQVVHELADNSFRHGRAATVGLGSDDQGLFYWDVGTAFNPLEELDASRFDVDKYVGSFVVQQFVQDFSKTIDISYVREVLSDRARRNVLRFGIPSQFPVIATSDRVDVVLDAPLSHGRCSARRWAEAVIIPPGIKEIVLTVGSIALMSGFFSYIAALLSRLPEDGTLKIYISRDVYAPWLDNAFPDSRVSFVVR